MDETFIEFTNQFFCPGEDVQGIANISLKETRLVSALRVSIFGVETIKIKAQNEAIKKAQSLIFTESSELFSRNIFEQIFYFKKSFNSENYQKFGFSLKLPENIPSSSHTVKYFLRLEDASKNEAISKNFFINVHQKPTIINDFTNIAVKGVTSESRGVTLHASLDSTAFRKNDVISAKISVFSSKISVKAIQFQLIECVEKALDDKSEIVSEEKTLFTDKIRDIVPVPTGKTANSTFSFHVPADAQLSSPNKKYHRIENHRENTETQGAHLGIYSSSVAISHVVRITAHKQRSRDSEIIDSLDLPILVMAPLNSYECDETRLSVDIASLTLIHEN